MDIQNIEELVDLIKSLKRSGDLEGAKNILLQCVEFMDSHFGPNDKKPPWYHAQLGIVLRKLGETDLGNSYSKKADEIILHNLRIHIMQVYEMSDQTRKDCYPNGPVITKKALEAAQRLYKKGATTVLNQFLLEGSKAISVSR